MRRMMVLLGLALMFIAAIAALPAAAQSLAQDLVKYVETPAITGYEQSLAAEIAAELKALAPKRDNLGNVIITLGSGTPRRMIVAPLDEPGYIVSAITADGFLRVQRLPQTAPNAIYDLMHAAQPVLIGTRKGKWISGVVAGLSTHLQTARQNPPRAAHPDEMYIDIGAATSAEVRAAGVDLLDPIAIERRCYDIGFSRLAGAATGDRFGAAALVELLRRLKGESNLHGTLVVAFVTENYAGARGLDRALFAAGTGGKVDEMVFVGRLRRAAGGAGGGGAGGAQARQGSAPALRAPRALPGSGISIGVTNPDAPLTGLAAELKQLAETNGIPAAADFSAPLPRGRNTESETQATPAPDRNAYLGVPTRWPVTPAEWLDVRDLENLVRLLEVYAHGAAHPPAMMAEVRPLGPRSAPARPATAPSATKILSTLVERYGASGHEAEVREAVIALLPPWAKPETDSAGNVIVRAGSGAKKGPSVLFVAHMDELGYAVTAVNDDGTLSARSLGGGISEFFMGHPVFVHTAAGIRPGVLQLPAGWDAPGFEWPRGPAAAQGAAAAGGAGGGAQGGAAGGQGGAGASPYRIETGARSAAEVAQLGIKVGDWVTIPKKYRSLYATRANGRSFDDRVGSTALVAAAWALGGPIAGRDVTFVWSTEEEVGLRGAAAVARRLASEGKAPDFVFAVDTFVSSDSPLESKRFADAPIGKGFVIRAVDNSSITERKFVDKLTALARANKIAVQYGVTGGGNDGSVFTRFGTVDVGIGWPLRYSHSPGEVVDTRDVDALGRIVAAIARAW